MKFNPLEVKAEFTGPDQEEQLLKAAQVGQIYKEGTKTPFWEHFRSLIEEKIETLDAQKDNCPDNGKGFRTWRAMRTEIKILRNLLKLPKQVMNVGQTAQQRLDDIQKQAEAKAAMSKKVGLHA